MTKEEKLQSEARSAEDEVFKSLKTGKCTKIDIKWVEMKTTTHLWKVSQTAEICTSYLLTPKPWLFLTVMNVIILLNL